MPVHSLFITLATATVKPATVWLPPQSSTVAPSIDFLFNFITWICYFFFGLITIVMVYFVWKYRRSPENHAGNAKGPTHNTPLELAWTIVPLLLAIVIFYLGFRGFVELTVAPKNSYPIAVTASQWNWLFTYPNGAQVGEDIVVVPAGQPVELTMRSADVIHSLYVPDFRVKQDVVPGRYSRLWFQCDHPTGMDRFHWLFCTEYCGTGHSTMNRKVHVLAQADFDEWLAQQSRWLLDIPDDELYFKAGPKLFARCIQCHSLDGTIGTGPSWGPRAEAGVPAIWDRTSQGLTRFVGAETLGGLVGPGKQFETPEDYIRDSILNPGHHLVQGFSNAMPTFKGQLDDRAIDALIGFMKHIDQFDSKGKWKNANPATAPGAAPK